jgi:hypothetical protein
MSLIESCNLCRQPNFYHREVPKQWALKSNKMN